ncbi:MULTISPECIES: sulfite exporter TauE/SafE family protein [Hydrocarboniphaga]|uniref:Probable membrane transporter protein n=1 Tax=Hydrocarboniphaga effusa AP103 TaxID=1172194 RepID=I8I5F8_9GAMM|nr:MULTISPECIES: sulfite exporter TauE/SafE family protein [Hydrocarboniphaga]EIT71656.1 hypothetical protein WQQ_17930 [Hydrocarboniphaga effusa AP103]MDZ4080282.1 sulfite exporter TauE/SafE family protein [Hydrocarboniphaga sp.]
MSDSLGFVAALAGAAFLTSTLSGVAGLGGGTVLIGLFYAIGLAPVEAIPLFAAVQLASNASRMTAYVRHVEWKATGWFLLASVPATFLLAPWVQHVDLHWTQLLLAALILASMLPSADSGASKLPEPMLFSVAGLLNGSLGLFVGATGLFVGRLFLRPGWRKETTIGTLALTQMLGHLLRVLAYGFAGFSAFANPHVLLPLCAAVIAGTITGRRLHAHLDERQFALLFKGLLIALSLKLLWDGVSGLLRVGG